MPALRQINDSLEIKDMESALRDILNSVTLRAALYFRTDFRPPFGVVVPDFRQVARFHLLVKGRCTIQAGAALPVRLEPGDLVLVPNGSRHLIASDGEAPSVLLEDAFVAAGYTGSGPFVLGNGDPEESCQLICGHFEFAHGSDHPLLEALPKIIHIPHGSRSVRPLFDDLIALLERRLFESDSTAIVSINRLSEALFIEILEAATESSASMARLMSVTSDPKIGRAITLFHQKIGGDWSVDALARCAGMSRTRFADRFHRLVGMAPMAYVAEWRLRHAHDLLREGNLSVKSVASRTGYSSAAAFSRAFAKRFGESPEKSRKVKSR